MIPASCRVTHRPPEQYGDCLRAAVASILELNTEAVPHFNHDNPSAEASFNRLRGWLATRGFTVFLVSFPPEPLDDVLEMIGESNPDGHYLLFGNTGEGDHVVVARGSRIVHNPAWYGSSLKQPLEMDGQRAWTVGVIGKL